MPASSVFSPDSGMGLSVVEGIDGGPPLAKQPEPGVLQEILAAAPKQLPSATDPDGGTLIGTETGAKPDDAAANTLGSNGSSPAAQGPKSALIESGLVEVQALPGHALERTSRAQVYYPLVTRCRDAEGHILPPDAVVLRFRVDEDGHIVPSSVSAIAVDPKYESAANCMRRELSAVSFRGLAAYRGTPISLKATIPSVD